MIGLTCLQCPLPWPHLGVQRKCIKPHGADEIDVSGLVKYRVLRLYCLEWGVSVVTWEYMISCCRVIHSPACLERTCTT